MQTRGFPHTPSLPLLRPTLLFLLDQLPQRGKDLQAAPLLSAGAGPAQGCRPWASPAAAPLTACRPGFLPARADPGHRDTATSEDPTPAQQAPDHQLGVLRGHPRGLLRLAPAAPSCPGVSTCARRELHPLSTPSSRPRPHRPHQGREAPGGHPARGSSTPVRSEAPPPRLLGPRFLTRFHPHLQTSPPPGAVPRPKASSNPVLRKTEAGRRLLHGPSSSIST